jgi:hypothetical protein
VTHAELLTFAAQKPPPQSWFDEDFSGLRGPMSFPDIYNLHEREPALAFVLILAEVDLALQRAMEREGIHVQRRLSLANAMSVEMLASNINPHQRGAMQQ